jgi:hypothetical protein
MDIGEEPKGTSPNKMITGEKSAMETGRNTDIFDLNKLISPDAFHWPGVLWFWNDRVEEGEVSRQLREIDSIGVKNIWVLKTRNLTEYLIIPSGVL